MGFRTISVARDAIALCRTVVVAEKAAELPTPPNAAGVMLVSTIVNQVVAETLMRGRDDQIPQRCGVYRGLTDWRSAAPCPSADAGIRGSLERKDPKTHFSDGASRLWDQRRIPTVCSCGR